jgi:hypothetical protein
VVEVRLLDGQLGMRHGSYYSSVAVKSILYDADGNETVDETIAVRGATVELDDDGNVVAEIETWEVDPKSIEGDEGEMATRPRHED